MKATVALFLSEKRKYLKIPQVYCNASVHVLSNPKHDVVESRRPLAKLLFVQHPRIALPRIDMLNP